MREDQGGAGGGVATVVSPVGATVAATVGAAVGATFASPVGATVASPPLQVAVLGRDAILRSGLASHLRACPQVAVVDAKARAAVVVMATDIIDAVAVEAVNAVRRGSPAGIVMLASRLGVDDSANALATGVCQWLGRRAATPTALADAVTAATACTHSTADHARAWAAATGAGDTPSGQGYPPANGHDRPPARVVAMNPGRVVATVPGAELSIALSDRDLDVLHRVAQGQSTAEIAEQLAYSESTIKNIVHQAVALLGARNRTHAVAVALRRGLI